MPPDALLDRLPFSVRRADGITQHDVLGAMPHACVGLNAVAGLNQVHASVGLGTLSVCANSRTRLISKGG